MPSEREREKREEWKSLSPAFALKMREERREWKDERRGRYMKREDEMRRMAVTEKQREEDWDEWLGEGTVRFFFKQRGQNPLSTDSECNYVNENDLRQAFIDVILVSSTSSVIRLNCPTSWTWLIHPMADLFSPCPLLTPYNMIEEDWMMEQKTRRKRKETSRKIGNTGFSRSDRQ